MKGGKKRQYKNDGFRSLYESAVYPEVSMALEDWKRNCNDKCVLIGWLAYSYYCKPRKTEDIDCLFLSENDLPNYAYGFKKIRGHSFEHIKTGVEVEVLSPEFLKLDFNYELIFKVANFSNGIKIANPVSLIALKLGRFSPLDQSDIIELSKYCNENQIKINLEDYSLSKIYLDRYNSLSDKINENFDNSFVLESNFYLSTKRYLKLDVDFKYDVYLFKESNIEPTVYIGKNFDKKIKRYNDFQFGISLDLSKGLEVTGSSTGYKSFNSFDKEGKEISKWIYENHDLLKNEWIKLNKI